jgi:hypothetical protein
MVESVPKPLAGANLTQQFITKSGELSLENSRHLSLPRIPVH